VPAENIALAGLAAVQGCQMPGNHILDVNNVQPTLGEHGQAALGHPHHQRAALTIDIARADHHRRVDGDHVQTFGHGALHLHLGKIFRITVRPVIRAKVPGVGFVHQQGGGVPGWQGRYAQGCNRTGMHHPAHTRPASFT